MASLLGSIAGWVKSLAGADEAPAPGAASAAAPAGGEVASPTGAAAGVAADAARPAAAGAASIASALPAMLPVKVIFATTTGTSQRFADVIRREAFAMHVSGFHFSVTAVAAANYPMDDIEKETAVVLFLMPTWTGGSPPASGKLLCDHVRDLATDFRVSKDTLSKLRYAVFGLGCREYGRNFCRAALDLDEQIASLGGSRLAACGTGDDQSDLDEAFAAWRAGLWPTLCELFARECGEPTPAAGSSAATSSASGDGCGDGCGSGSAGGAGASDKTSFGAYRKSGAGVFTEAGDDEYADEDGDGDEGEGDGSSAAAAGCCGGGKAAAGVDGGCCKDSSSASSTSGVGAASGCGCGTDSGSSAAAGAGSSSAASASSAGASAGASATGPAFLPLREYRKMRRNLPPAERAAFDATRRAMALAAKGIALPKAGSGAGSETASTAAASAGGAGDDATVGTGAASDDDGEDDDTAAALGGGELEEDEEDRLNAQLLAAADADGIDAPSAAASALRHPADSDDEDEAAAAARAAARAAAGAPAGASSASSRGAPRAAIAARTAAVPLSAAERIMEAEGGDAAAAAAAAGASSPSASAAGGGAGAAGLADVEDLAAVLAAGKGAAAGDAATSASAGASASADAAAAAAAGPREMVTPMQRRALTKEGYKLIGSHSAVKICRWTKAQLRGRGGCYKHSFYGIQSHLCMEVTPSLACANKCVFCWRHHKNPVGTSWRWKVDDPVSIVEQAIAKHVREIRSLRGLPGIRMERWREAHTPRHCALSLVGEPIMYPHIGTLLRQLHSRGISSFLVTNAQFPECIAGLPPVTQLYVSIDAATKETLKAIDRPLFKDFWERFLASLDALRDRRQRTVYRLTLVKSKSAGIADGSAPADAPDDGNMGQLDEYAALVSRGQPDFIEIKGVTWCGTSPGSTLTMANVPWHHEVKSFCEALAARVGGTYGLAAEHAHSCCVLLAKKDPFLREGVWHTQINYPRFFELFARWEATGAAFTSEDYMAPTSPWAVYGCDAAGFDPEEVRHYRRKDGSVAAVEYKSSESGCG